MIIEYVIFIIIIAVTCLAVPFYRPEKSFIYELMKSESYIERRLIETLIANGHAPTSQLRIGKYRADIALMEHRVIIECDGDAYHSRPRHVKRDNRRDSFMKSNGWIVLRFKGSEIVGEINYVMTKINKTILESRQAGRT